MAAPAENYSLIADIGGTNARLQLVKFTRDSKVPDVVKSTFYLNKDFVTFTDCLREFLKEYEGTDKRPQNATLAVAAAPFNNKLKMVNCHWPEIDGTALGQEFKIQPFTLINDFEAIGYSLLKVGPEHLLQINDVQKTENRTMAVVGSGTGLGECVLQPVKNVVDGSIQYAICPTEGGHKDFSPTEKIDFDYLQFCLETPEIKEMGYLSTEASFCGPAVPNMYKFLCQREGAQAQELTSKDIFQKGIKKEDPICVKVLDLYARLYGKELGNFACDCLPYSGIYLVGGMINSIRDYFANKDPSSPFMKAYFSKDKVTNNVLGRFPIYIVTYDELGLLGSFVKAQIDAFAGK